MFCKAALFQFVVTFLKSAEIFRRFAWFYRDRKYMFIIVIEHNENIFMAAFLCHRISSCKINIDQIFHIIIFNKEYTYFMIFALFFQWFQACWANIWWYQPYVSLCCCNFLCTMAFDLFCSLSRPCSEESFSNCFIPLGDRGTNRNAI